MAIYIESVWVRRHSESRSYNHCCVAASILAKIPVVANRVPPQFAQVKGSIETAQVHVLSSAIVISLTPLSFPDFINCGRDTRVTNIPITRQSGKVLLAQPG